MEGKIKKYVPSGKNISIVDAEKVGQAIELLIAKIGRNPTAAEFAHATKSTKNPAHEIVKRRYELIKQSAWHRAACECIRSVDIIWVDSKGGEIERSKAFFILNIQSKDSEDSEDSDHYKILTQDQASRSAEAIALQRQIMMNVVRTAIMDFASIAGFKKAIASAVLVIKELSGKEDTIKGTAA